RAPSQCSIKGWLGLVAEGPAWPTAQTSLGETTATSVSWCWLGPRLGLATRLQLVASQCSTKGCRKREEAGRDEPTAQMPLAEAAAMPRSSCSPGSRSGLGTVLQLVPSKCSSSGRRGLVVAVGPLTMDHPTAQTSLAEIAATSVRILSPVP